MSTPEQPNHFTGGCQCGAVHFEVAVAPARVLACHCTTCKQRTGSAFGVGLYFEDAAVTFSGAPMTVYEFRSDTTDRWIRNEFCASCGTAVTWTTEMRPGLRAIAAGALDDPASFYVDAHIWTRSARPDMRYPDDMPTHEKALGE